MTNPNEPINSGTEYGNPQWKWGLTKREFFAAMAMQGFAQFGWTDDIERPGKIAIHSIALADAIIYQLNKGPK